MSVVSQYRDPLTIVKYVDDCDIVAIPDNNYSPMTATSPASGTLSLYVTGCSLGSFPINFIFSFFEEVSILDLTHNTIKTCEGLVSVLKQKRIR